MDVLRRLARLGGAARFHELQTSRHVLARLVDARLVERVERGCYALPGADRSAVVAARLNGRVGCVSALRAYGLEVPGDAFVVHVSVPASRGSSLALPVGVRRHHEAESDRRAGHLVGLAPAIARAVRCLAYDDAVAVLDAAGRLDLAGARAALRLLGPRSVALARSLTIDTNPRARSVIETRVRLALRRAGHSVLAGVVLPGVGEVDLLVDGRIIVELDGFAYHSGREQYRADRRRDRAALRLGLITLRFAWEDSAPEIVVAAVAEALGVLGDARLPPSADLPEAASEALDAVVRLASGEASRAVGRWRVLDEAVTPLALGGRGSLSADERADRSSGAR